ALVGDPATCAAELVETAALADLAGLEIIGLHDAALRAADELKNPHARLLMQRPNVEQARRAFLHWRV
ncbi:MAG: hypothetical protein WBP81_09235, partial [Solirubrobacteraceae bacterium]